jgi:GTPase SAR1 family protein
MKQSEFDKIVCAQQPDGKLMTIEELEESLNKLSKRKFLSLLLNAVSNNKIKLLEHRSNDSLLISPILKKVVNISSDSEATWKLLKIYLLFTKLHENQSIQDFHKLTKNEFIGHNIFKFFDKLRLRDEYYKLFFNLVNQYINGRQPAYLSDLNLTENETVYFNSNIVDSSNILLKQELFKVRIDWDGISTGLSLTNRSLKLLKNENIYHLNMTDEINQGVFRIKKHEILPSRVLFYNKKNDELFNDIVNICNKVDVTNSNISILLYGESGTGKTEFVYQLAKNINADVFQLDFTQIITKWVGESEKRVKNAFFEYKKMLDSTKKPLILLMNEADSLMNRRVTVNNSNDVFSNHLQGQLLELLEEFKGILIATTNLKNNIDKAFYRRFMFIENIELPNYEVREKLLKNSLLHKYIEDELRSKLLNSNWSPAQLLNVEMRIHQLMQIKDIENTFVNELLIDNGLLTTSKHIGFRN